MMVTRVQVVSKLVILCRPPLALVDGRRIDGLDQRQYDDLQVQVWRYHRSLWGALDPLPSFVGRGTDYNRAHIKRHKPGSLPPPRSADPTEPDWFNSKLAAAIESLTPTEQSLIIMKVAEERTNEQCGAALGKSARWVSSRWGPLATWLYFRMHGQCD